MGKNLSQTKPNVEKTQSTACPAQLAMGHMETTTREDGGATHTAGPAALLSGETLHQGTGTQYTRESAPNWEQVKRPPQSGSVNHSGVTQWRSLSRDNGPGAVAPTAQRDVRENQAEHDSIPSSSDKPTPHCLATESWWSDDKDTRECE